VLVSTLVLDPLLVGGVSFPGLFTILCVMTTGGNGVAVGGFTAGGCGIPATVGGVDGFFGGCCGVSVVDGVGGFTTGGCGIPATVGGIDGITGGCGVFLVG